MQWCKRHNHFHARGCAKCEAEGEAAERTEQRLADYKRQRRQRHARCHECFNLAPWCVCDGGYVPTIDQIQRSINDEAFNNMLTTSFFGPYLPEQHGRTISEEEIRQALDDDR